MNFKQLNEKFIIIPESLCKFILYTFTIAIIIMLFISYIALALNSIFPSGPQTLDLPKNPRNIMDLIEGSIRYDKTEIVIEGEVIGDIMIRGDIGWINIVDNAGSIGVWGSSGTIKKIGQTGRYRQKGDMVRIKGVFYRADPNQGGELDIYAESIEIIEPGYFISESIAKGKLDRLGVTGLMSIFVCILWIKKILISKRNI